MSVQNETAVFPTSQDLGGNEFTFTGDRTSITFFPSTPGPVVVGHEGGELRYDGPEGNFVFFGQEIQRLDSPLGALLTVLLKPNNDTGAINITLLIQQCQGERAVHGAPGTR
jgi:hypothetical protein